jgi:hypothetical protein
MTTKEATFIIAIAGLSLAVWANSQSGSHKTPPPYFAGGRANQFAAMNAGQPPAFRTSAPMLNRQAPTSLATSSAPSSTPDPSADLDRMPLPQIQWNDFGRFYDIEDPHWAHELETDEFGYSKPVDALEGKVASKVGPIDLANLSTMAATLGHPVSLLDADDMFIGSGSLDAILDYTGTKGRFKMVVLPCTGVSLSKVAKIVVE